MIPENDIIEMELMAIRAKKRAKLIKKAQKMTRKQLLNEIRKGMKP